MGQALIIQVPAGSPVARQLRAQPPAGSRAGAIVVEALEPDAEGNLDPPPAGEVVLSVPSPESLSREPDEVREIVSHAGAGTEPLVLVIEVAEELRDEELAAVLDAASRAPRPVILRVIRSS
jgi:hypothetical protein